MNSVKKQYESFLVSAWSGPSDHTLLATWLKGQVNDKSPENSRQLSPPGRDTGLSLLEPFVYIPKGCNLLRTFPSFLPRGDLFTF